MDIHDLAYIYFSIGYDADIRRMKKIDKFFSKSYILGGVFFFLRFIDSFFSYGLRLPKPKADNRFLVLGLSNNNSTTLKPLTTELITNGYGVIDITKAKDFPMWKLYFYSIKHLHNLIKDIISANKEERKVFKSRFALIWRTYGGQRLAKEMLLRYNPHTIIVASDQDPFYRAALKQAKAYGIQTVYVQHAAVTNKFPPLDFTYSFLDGKESLNKYKEAGKVKGNIVLSGGVRFDLAASYLREKTENRIGVAINTIDDQNRVISLCYYLFSKGYKIIFRPHPTMGIKTWKKWCLNNKIDFSDPKIENSFQFLSKINLLISNQSSIHLDAAICGVKSTLYNFSSGQQNDYYGFLSSGLIRESKSFEDIICAIKYEYDRTSDIVRYYNSSSQTSYFGSVAILICTVLTQPKVGDCFNRKLEKIEIGDEFIVYDIVN